jgi:hypothetical protein
MSTEWPGEFVSAEELFDDGSEPEDVTVFNDGGVIYCTGGERTQEYLYMENRPASMENRC